MGLLICRSAGRMYGRTGTWVYGYTDSWKQVDTLKHTAEQSLTFPERQFLDSSKLKEFADDNYKLIRMTESSPNE